MTLKLRLTSLFVTGIQNIHYETAGFRASAAAAALPTPPRFGIPVSDRPRAGNERMPDCGGNGGWRTDSTAKKSPEPDRRHRRDKTRDRFQKKSLLLHSTGSR